MIYWCFGCQKDCDDDYNIGTCIGDDAYCSECITEMQPTEEDIVGTNKYMLGLI